jgi:DNA-binding transcriptional LysR family regulator
MKSGFSRIWYTSFVYHKRVHKMDNLKTPTLRTHMNMRQMVLLVHLSRETSILKAAEAVGMSQPAASTLLKQLEDALGVTLFERYPRGVEPNAYGEIAIRHAISILSDVQRAQEEIAALKRGESCKVAIGSVLTPGIELVPKAIVLLERQHSQMTVSVEIDNSKPLIQKLLEGKLDIVIGRVLDPQHLSEVDWEAITEEPYSLVGRSGHPLARRRRTLLLEDLVDYAWIVPPSNSVMREHINALFLRNGLPFPSRVVENFSAPVMVRLLQCSDMLAALPAAVVEPYCETGVLKVIPIEHNLKLAAYGIITRKDHPLSRDANALLAAIRSVVKTGEPAAPSP